MVFWFIFFVLILCLFVLNWKVIRANLDSVGLLDRFTNRPADNSSPEDTSWLYEPADEDDGPVPESPSATTVETPPEANPADPAANTPATSEPVATAPDAEQQPQQTKKLANIERALYFIRVDQGDGTILRIKVNRTLPVSDSPMVDVLNTLLQGPSDAEKRQGLISLIPPGTRILAASVRGSTAYISFSEEFEINNTHGMEGYKAQLQQIVWSVTEFSTVKDVQVLIEGRRMDYLGGEGIWIGSPLNRESF
ncbi:hypothetical protein FACS1894130_12090 [Spirochaetia bacterium]|nr:hypothetical protein FACS1894130_12090 [Spirochaetia bacterium]